MQRLIALGGTVVALAGFGTLVLASEAAPELAFEVIGRRPHDAAAFTQGLQADEHGRLYESTGLYGHSSLRQVDPQSGQVLRMVALPDDRFGEGLARVDDRLIQLTWRSGEALVWDMETLTLLETIPYEGQGWGLCHDGARLVMSDGSSTLTYRDPVTFAVIGSVPVTLDGEPVDDLNELECVGGSVWANVWHSDEIMRIDPADGTVSGVLDLGGILEPDPSLADSEDVLNGIAYDAETGNYLVTGKRWPEIIEISILDGGGT
jgi:glutaminyl-peptide cyclotransferase